MQNRIAFDARICPTLRFGVDFALKQMTSYIALTRRGKDSLPYLMISPHPQIPLHAALITPVAREDYDIHLPGSDTAVGLNRDMCPELRYNLKIKGDAWTKEKLQLFRFFITDLEGRFRTAQTPNIEYPNYLGLPLLKQFLQDDALLLKPEPSNNQAVIEKVQETTQETVQIPQKPKRRKKAEEGQTSFL